MPKDRRLYLLQRIKGHDYDKTEGMVVAASSSRAARKYAQQECGDQDREYDDVGGEFLGCAPTWTSPKWSSIQLIGTAHGSVKVPSIVIVDFLRG